MKRCCSIANEQCAIFGLLNKHIVPIYCKEPLILICPASFITTLCIYVLQKYFGII